MTVTLETTMTQPHKELIQLLESIGLDCVEEVKFSPYIVDIYVPSLHIAFEADGPMHNKKKDDTRDYRLESVYALPVIRVRAESIMAGRAWKDIAVGLLRGTIYEETSIERANKAYKSGWQW